MFESKWFAETKEPRIGDSNLDAQESAGGMSDWAGRKESTTCVLKSLR